MHLHASYDSGRGFPDLFCCQKQVLLNRNPSGLTSRRSGSRPSRGRGISPWHRLGAGSYIPTLHRLVLALLSGFTASCCSPAHVLRPGFASLPKSSGHVARADAWYPLICKAASGIQLLPCARPYWTPSSPKLSPGHGPALSTAMDMHNHSSCPSCRSAQGCHGFLWSCPSSSCPGGPLPLEKPAGEKGTTGRLTVPRLPCQPEAAAFCLDPSSAHKQVVPTQ